MMKMSDADNLSNADSLGLKRAVEERAIPNPQYNPGVELTQDEKEKYIDGYNYGRRWCMFNKNKIGKSRNNTEYDNSVPGELKGEMK